MFTSDRQELYHDLCNKLVNGELQEYVQFDDWNEKFNITADQKAILSNHDLERALVRALNILSTQIGIDKSARNKYCCHLWKDTMSNH
jgi:hypothetical protein